MVYGGTVCEMMNTIDSALMELTELDNISGNDAYLRLRNIVWRINDLFRATWRTWINYPQLEGISGVSHRLYDELQSNFNNIYPQLQGGANVSNAQIKEVVRDTIDNVLLQIQERLPDIKKCCGEQQYKPQDTDCIKDYIRDREIRDAIDNLKYAISKMNNALEYDPENPCIKAIKDKLNFLPNNTNDNPCGCSDGGDGGIDKDELCKIWSAINENCIEDFCDSKSGQFIRRNMSELYSVIDMILEGKISAMAGNAQIWSIIKNIAESGLREYQNEYNEHKSKNPNSVRPESNFNYDIGAFLQAIRQNYENAMNTYSNAPYIYDSSENHREELIQNNWGSIIAILQNLINSWGCKDGRKPTFIPNPGYSASSFKG